MTARKPLCPRCADPWSFDFPERLEVAHGHVLAALDAIEGRKPPRLPEQTVDSWDDRCAPEDRAQTRSTPRDDLPPSSSPIGADLMMVAPLTPVHPGCTERRAEDAEIIRRLRTALARALCQRDEARARALHWYVDNDGYCAACNCPESNTGRHAKRAA